ncbi:hypothetical protein IIA16_05805 [bacterium]|nr:hypothetical protein [bacterium]
MCQESLSPTFSRRPSLWALSVLAVSFGMTACLDLVTDQAMAKLTGDSPDRSAPLTPEQVLERMAATLQEMDTLSVQVDGFWAAALQGGDTSGVLQLARPGKVSWIEEGNSFGPSVESVVSDGTPEGLLRWEYIPRDNTYRMRTDTPEDWGLPPEEALTNAFVTDVTTEIDGDVLDVRRGPDVTDPGAQSNEVSKRNVFVLIEPGTNRNANVGRAYVRDSNHTGDKLGGPWPLDATDPPVTIKDVRFSATHNIDTTDSGNDGDDTLLVMSFINYKALLNEYGLNMEVVCEAC